MGKIRVKALGDETLEELEKQEAKKRKETKKAEKAQDVSMDETPVLKPEKQQQTSKPKAENKKQKTEKKSSHSKKYQTVAAKVDKQKTYSLAEALYLLPQLTIARFDETVELHVNTLEPGISGSVTLPHGTGKKVRVAIANDEVIAAIEKGSITFDVLVTEPHMMPKLAKVARILGPRGLMPNPKNGTVTAKPEEVAKKFAGGQVNYKTEAKLPLLHLAVGKVSFGKDKLEENITVAVKAIGKNKIKNITLKSTMSPGIKINVA